MVRAITLVLMLAAGAGQAQQIDRSPRPQANPNGAGLVAVAKSEGASPAGSDAATVSAAAADDAGLDGLRPKLRPPELEAGIAAALALAGASVAKTGEEAQLAVADLAPDPETAADGALSRSPRPEQRPRALANRIAALKATSDAPGLDLSSNPGGDEVELAAAPPPTAREKRKKKREAASMEGAVCGVPAIKGTEIKRISSKVRGCGVEDPVAVTSVAGVRLSQTATVDCSIAKALNQWVDEVAQPAFDGKLVELQVAAHYICRSRNNIRGAKISEHGKGRAIDVSGFVMSNGKVLTVSNNFNKVLRRIYKAACPYFRTTLGPGSDGYHENHFHFDTSARDGGSYCR